MSRVTTEAEAPVAAAIKPRKINMLQGINLGLAEAMADSEKVFLIGEDIADPQGGGVFKVTQGLSERFGEKRVRSTPISEQAIIGAAVGAAIAGYRPVAEIMLMNFITVAMDQVVNHAAKLRFMSGGQTHVPLTIRMATGSGFGNGGQHSDQLEAWFAHTAGCKVVIPSGPAEAAGLIYASIFDDDPVIFVESIPLYYVSGPAPAPGQRIPLGKARIARAGTDVTLIGYGRSVNDLLMAAQALEQEGVAAEVIDLRTVAPFDAETILTSVAKTRRAVVVHEAVTPFGVGAEISARIHEELFSDLKAPVRRVGSNFQPVPFSKPLESDFLYSQAQIFGAVRKTLG
ncbi:transketolase C-terminal domain-containing protein [Sphingomonadaceae bacterium jetA1]|jgi:pyruvate dehydrogenase E1 component beta subunit|uniref:alpha-ketoacid dehydrogenase subunit beta n=1 Tax=Facivitalis istanbulensis TaxID=3075838 RepID=UPI0034869477